MTSVGIGLLAFGGFIIVMPWLALVGARNGRGVSGIPLLGGVLAAAGLAILPGVEPWLAVVPLVVDPFCVPTLVVLLYRWWRST